MRLGRPFAALTGSLKFFSGRLYLEVIAALVAGCFLLLSFVVHNFCRLLQQRNGRRRHPVILIVSNAT
jgi:hypothetical protein